MESHQAYKDKFIELVTEITAHDLESDDATAKIKNLEVFSKCRPPADLCEPTKEPTTFLGKLAARCGAVWDNETTRVLIKAGGTFAGVALVVQSTIQRDRVLDRQALAQAALRN